MIFINPKIDFAFKKIFGSEQSKDILISFLNALLYEAQPIIQDLEIITPYMIPKIRGVKDIYLDVKAKISGGKTVIIKMQVLNVEGFEKRILYNAAKAYSIQLDVGERYNLLEPVIALTITDFEMFREFANPISRFVLKEKEFLVDYLSYDIELVFVELPKFTKEIDEVESLTDKWIYFLKTARSLKTVPETMREVPEIQKAFDMANQAHLSREELDDLSHGEMYIQDQKNIIIKATKQGREQGIKQGIEQCIKQGREQGMKQGKVEIAKRMLGVLDEETISQTTGLSLEEVRQLKLG